MIHRYCSVPRAVPFRFAVWQLRFGFSSLTSVGKNTDDLSVPAITTRRGDLMFRTNAFVTTAVSLTNGLTSAEGDCPPTSSTTCAPPPGCYELDSLVKKVEIKKGRATEARPSSRKP